MSVETMDEKETIQIVDVDEEDKTRSVAVLRHTIQHVRSLEDGHWHSSPSFYVQGLKWAIEMKIGTDVQHVDLLFGIFLRYLGGADPTLPVVRIEGELRLIDQLKSDQNSIKEINDLFDTSSNTIIDCSKWKFWSDVLDPRRGYVKDDTLIVEIYLAATPPQQKLDFNPIKPVSPVKLSKIQTSPSLSTSKSDDELLKCKLSGLAVTDRAQSLLDSGVGSDCEFLVCHNEEKKSFKASKVFLAKYSEVFERMFFGDFKEESPVIIQDVRPEIFHQMLKYTYGCKWSLESGQNAMDLYYLADRFLMDELKEICIKYIWPTNENNLWYAFELDTFYDLKELRSAAIKIICQRTGEVFNCHKFLCLNITGLIAILAQNNLTVTSELQVFTAAQKWAAFQCHRKGLTVDGVNLRAELGRGMQYIRFLTMSIADLIGDPVESGILTPDETISFVRAIVDRNKYLPPAKLCALRKPRQKC